MKVIVVNSTHLVADQYGNKFTYRFPSPASFQDDQIAVSACNIYYSWRNIDATYDNTSFSYRWVDGNVYTVSIDQGYYTATTLNTYLQKKFIERRHYLLSSTGTYIYYVSMSVNPAYYAIQLNCYAVPTAAQAAVLEYTRPVGATWDFPATARTPQVIIPATGFRDIVGLTEGSYPPTVQTTDYEVLSSYTPQVHPIQSLLIHVNVIDNQLSNPNTVIQAFTPDVSYGSLITYQPPEFTWADIRSGSYESIQLFFTDQQYRPVRILDSNLVVSLVVKKKSDITNKG